MNQEISDRTLEIFYTLIRGEFLSNRKIADRYGVSTRTVSRDIGRIQNFFYEHRDIMNNAEIVYSHKDKAYILKSDEFLKNSELFALVKVILGARCFSKEDTLTLIRKIKQFTTPNDRNLLESIIKKEVFHYREVRSDCDSVIDNLWRIVQCIEQRRCISIRYIKMDRTEVIRKLHPSAVMFSEYYFYLIAYEPDGEPAKAKYYRIDRIRSIVEHREKYVLDQSNDFDEGELREKNQFMFPGDLVQITFEFSGLSLQSVLDRLPTARVIEKNGSKSIVTAEVNYGRGLIMYLLSQGSWIKVLSPQPLIDDMKGEIQKMAQHINDALCVRSFHRILRNTRYGTLQRNIHENNHFNSFIYMTICQNEKIFYCILPFFVI